MNIKELIEYLTDCPYLIDQASVPKMGIEIAPEQVVGTLSLSYLKYLELLSLAKELKKEFTFKGEIIELIGGDYGVKWSDMHSFGHGNHYVESKLKDNDLKGHSVGDRVEIKILPLVFEKDFHQSQEAEILNKKS